MKRKAWLLVAALLIIISQIIVLSSFFYQFQAQGIAHGNSVIAISKMSYVTGWASIDITGASQTYPVTLQWTNGTRNTLISEFSFVMKLPRTGDCFCNGQGTVGLGIEVSQSHPIVASVVSNVSNFDLNSLPPNGTPRDPQGLIVVYWFTVQGDASVFITGYGVAY